MSRDISFLLLSGGIGSRSGHYEPKQFRRIQRLEMMAYALRVAAAHPRVAEILVNAPEGYAERTQVLCREHAPGVKIKILPCGVSRQESVKILADQASYGTIILHEAARPMIDKRMIDELLACEIENAGLFSAIPFSMCEIDLETGNVKANIPREKVFNIQLPQKFAKNDLVEAHRLACIAEREFTEDSVMIHEMLGKPVRAIAGHVKNIKVTTREDFGIVSRLMEEEENQK